MKGETKTTYGVVKEGSSRFIFIAPHAGGDDKKTGFISRELAKLLKGSYVVNQHYFKPINSKSKLNPENISDFNRLSWSHKQQKYIWSKKHPALKEFYNDIARLCDSIFQKNTSKAIAVHVHGMNKKDTTIDLGVGLKEDEQGNLHQNTTGHIYTGRETLPRNKLYQLRDALDKNLTKPHNGVTIGKHYPAYSKRMGIQYHRNTRDDWSIQVEIDESEKRDQESIKDISLIIAKSLQETFE